MQISEHNFRLLARIRLNGRRRGLMFDYCHSNASCAYSRSSRTSSRGASTCKKRNCWRRVVPAADPPWVGPRGVRRGGITACSGWPAARCRSDGRRTAPWWCPIIRVICESLWERPSRFWASLSRAAPTPSIHCPVSSIYMWVSPKLLANTAKLDRRWQMLD